MIPLPKVKGEYRLNYNLSHLTWFKVGGPAEVFFKPLDAQDLADFLKQNQGRRPVTIIGAGSNIIIRDDGIDGVVVKLGQAFTKIELLPDNKISVGAACLNFNLAQFCKGFGLVGLEFLIGIPGTIGGGIAMNAGAYGREFKDIVVEIEALDAAGKFHNITASEIIFKYRGNNLPKDLIITKVIFKGEAGHPEDIAKACCAINEARTSTQPIKERTGGSTFANPPEGLKAWQLIEQAGMRGARSGDAQMSELHCNFMINLGGARANDLEQLGELVREKVLQKSGVQLEWEIRRLGKK